MALHTPPFPVWDGRVPPTGVPIRSALACDICRPHRRVGISTPRSDAVYDAVVELGSSTGVRTLSRIVRNVLAKTVCCSDRAWREGGRRPSCSCVALRCPFLISPRCGFCKRVQHGTNPFWSYDLQLFCRSSRSRCVSLGLFGMRFHPRNGVLLVVLCQRMNARGREEEEGVPEFLLIRSLGHRANPFSMWISRDLNRFTEGMHMHGCLMQDDGTALSYASIVGPEKCRGVRPYTLGVDGTSHPSVSCVGRSCATDGGPHPQCFGLRYLQAASVGGH